MSAQTTWDEAIDGGGDTGEKPGQAFEVCLLGQVGTITGTLQTNSSDKVDMIEVLITDPMNFSATITQFPNTDYQIWLFDENESLICWDNTIGDGIASIDISNCADLATTAGGDYYIAVTHYDTYPLNNGGAPVTTNGGKLDKWEYDESTTSAGPYTIEVEGICYICDPENVLVEIDDEPTNSQVNEHFVSYCFGAPAIQLKASGNSSITFMDFMIDCSFSRWVTDLNDLDGSTVTTSEMTLVQPAVTTTYYALIECGDNNEVICFDAVTVEVPTPPVTPVIETGGAIAFCQGGNVALTATTPTVGTIQWSTGETGNSITVSDSGVYTATIIDDNGCGATSDGVTIDVFPLPTTPTIDADGALEFCTGDAVVLTANSATGSSFLWSTGETTSSITVNASGIFSVAVTDNNGCTSDVSEEVQVTVFDTPPTPTIIASGPLVFCEGGSVVLTSSSSSDNIWSTGETTPNITVTTGGNYTVYTDDGGSCVSNTSEVITVTVNPLPIAPTIEADGPLNFCEGENVTLSINNSAGYSVLWSTGETTNNINVNTTGTYTVSVTDNNGCSVDALSAAQVTVFDVPAIPTVEVTGPLSFCEGGTVTLTAGNVDGQSILWSTGATTTTIEVGSVGDYFVTVINANGCESTSESTTITVNPLPPTPSINANGNTTFCAGESVELVADGINGNNILWSTGETTNSIVVTTSGMYSVSVTDINGCSSTSAPITVTVNPLPAMPIISFDLEDTEICAYETLTLSSSSPAGNTWSTGENTQDIVVNTAGMYSVTVVDVNGCSAVSDVLEVTVLAADDPSCFSCTGALDTVQLCRQGALLGVTDFPVSGNEVYTWYDENGIQVAQLIDNPYYSPAMLGTYTLVVTDPDYPDCFQVFGPRTITELNGCCELDDCEREVLGAGSGSN